MRSDLDGTYNRRAWNEETPNWSYTGPFATHEEQLTQQALTVMFMTAAEISTYVRPPIPQVSLFRPRYGYGDYADRQPGIDTVATKSRLIPDRSEWYSGTPAGYAGGSRFMNNSLGTS